MASKDGKRTGDKEQEDIVARITAHYVEEVQAGHQPDSSEYIARYPQYADAIASFIAYYQSVELPLLQMMDNPDTLANATESEDVHEFADELHIAIDFAWQHVMSPEIVVEFLDSAASREIEQIPLVRRSGTDDAVYGPTLQSLFITSKQRKLSPSQLATHLGLSADVVMLLEQRALLPESIPFVLCRQLATTLQRPLLAVQHYFGEGRLRHVAEHPGVYEMEEREIAPDIRFPQRKNSFREAVGNSQNMTEEQKSFWNDVLTREGL